MSRLFSRIFSIETALLAMAVIAALIVLAIVVPPFLAPAPAQAPSPQIAQSTPLATPTRTQTPTQVPSGTIPSVRPQTLIPVPTPPAQAQAFTFKADPGKSGWISSGDLAVHWGDRNLHAGAYKNQTYQSILYFDVSPLAPGSKILYAELQITGLSRENLRGDGAWNLRWLASTLLPDWSQRFAADFKNAAPQSTIGAALSAEQINNGQGNQFIFSAEQRAQLEKLLDTYGSVGFRIDGSNSAIDNLFTWDLGNTDFSADAAPVLRLVAVQGQYTLITSTPTPLNVLTAAARIAQATQLSARIGTPTSLPRMFATAAPFSTATPTAIFANGATATAQSIYATAVALTTGTFTPAPFFIAPTATMVPTSTPLFLVAGQFTPIASATPTVELSRWSAYQTPFPPELNLSGDILFLTNRESTGPNSSNNIAVYAMRPDGTLLGKLTAFNLWQTVVNRGLFAPDGRRYLDVARDARGLWMIVVVDQSGMITPLIQEPDNAKGLGAYDPAWSPLGDKIVYSSGRTGIQEIYLYDFATRSSTRLTNTTTPVSDYAPSSKGPSWSPDGKQIVYWSDGFTNPPHPQLYMLDLATGASRNISIDTYNNWNPVWIRK